jgi:flavin reductase (DIM6/NTAB) family NADH-FMN oxidoreductase RutF
MERLSRRRVEGLDQALALIPSGSFVLTAAHDDCRSGTLVQWVQRCAESPAMVVVALRKGHPIEPLIRDSRAFCLNLLREGEVLLRRKFETGHTQGDDPFVSLPATQAPSGSPVLLRAVAYVDCELMRHLDIESDFEVYIGLVKQTRILQVSGAASTALAGGMACACASPLAVKASA